MPSAVISLYLPEDVAQKIAISDGEEPEDLHITLAYLGDDVAEDKINKLVSLLSEFAESQQDIVGKLNGVARFTEEEPNPFVLLFDSAQVVKARQCLIGALEFNDVWYSVDHGFIPHVTITYLEPADENPFNEFETLDVTLATLTLDIGDQRWDFPLRHPVEPPEVVPTYHESTGIISCATCAFFKYYDWCTRFSFNVSALWTCDDYISLSSQLPCATDDSPENGVYVSGKATTGDGEGNNLKLVNEENDTLTVANYIVLWGSATERDLEGVMSKRVNRDGSHGEYFTADTKFESEYTKSIGKLAVDWEHRRDGEGPGDEVLGFVDWKSARIDELGIWVKRVLNRRNRFVQILHELGWFEKGLLGTSSEPINHLVRKTVDGRILTWPLRGDTLTVMPMDPRMLSGVQLEQVKSLGMTLEEGGSNNEVLVVRSRIEMQRRWTRINGIV